MTKIIHPMIKSGAVLSDGAAYKFYAKIIFVKLIDNI